LDLKKVTELLSLGFKMSYNPALERCVYLIKNESEASRRFYLYLDKMLSLHDTIKFMMAILVNLKKQAQHQLQNFSEEMGDNLEEDDKENQKVPFIYYVSTFLGFLDPLPPHVSMFLVLKISKNCHFLTPHPPTGAYVMYEWSQRVLVTAILLTKMSPLFSRMEAFV
jgi:hypothetical protein